MNHLKSFFFALLLGFPSLLMAQVDPQNVTISRDEWGVPHIHGHTDPEVAYGLAWANA
jgi:acyl-homoserine-lactone acylase